MPNIMFFFLSFSLELASSAERTTSLRSALEASSMEKDKKKNIIFGMQAKMAIINEALQNDAIKEGAWLLLNFSPDWRSEVS